MLAIFWLFLGCNGRVIDVAKTHGISYFVGSEDNVLERYHGAASKSNLDIIIRVTSDCPFIDPFILDDMIKFYKKNDFDYVRND